jgi:hypothetical protein
VKKCLDFISGGLILGKFGQFSKFAYSFENSKNVNFGYGNTNLFAPQKHLHRFCFLSFFFMRSNSNRFMLTYLKTLRKEKITVIEEEIIEEKRIPFAPRPFKRRKDEMEEMREAAGIK